MLLDMKGNVKRQREAKRFTGVSTASADLWHEYEQRKRAWVARHGCSDQAAYDAMILKLTKDLGI